MRIAVFPRRLLPAAPTEPCPSIDPIPFRNGKDLLSKSRRRRSFWHLSITRMPRVPSSQPI